MSSLLQITSNVSKKIGKNKIVQGQRDERAKKCDDRAKKEDPV
jgi:hypothetical protein